MENALIFRGRLTCKAQTVELLPLSVRVVYFRSFSRISELDENGSALINSSLLSFSEEHITDESSTHDDNEDQGTGQKRSSPRRALRGEYYRSLSFTFKRL
eukprot:scaffold926_cov166-Ochromonas_danica.AAC.10